VELRTSITFATATNHCSPHQPSLHYRISVISICHLHLRFSGCLKQVYLWYCLSLRGVIFRYLCRDCLISGLTPFRRTWTTHNFEIFCTQIPCSLCTVISHLFRRYWKYDLLQDASTTRIKITFGEVQDEFCVHLNIHAFWVISSCLPSWSNRHKTRRHFRIGCFFVTAKVFLQMVQ
jgi:hypothetical protein